VWPTLVESCASSTCKQPQHTHIAAGTFANKFADRIYKYRNRKEFIKMYSHWHFKDADGLPYVVYIEQEPVLLVGGLEGDAGEPLQLQDVLRVAKQTDRLKIYSAVLGQGGVAARRQVEPRLAAIRVLNDPAQASATLTTNRKSTMP
jgi:hypothetical protein